VIAALIAGRLFGAPQQRTSKHGKPFATCKVRVTTSNGESLFANVIAFAAPTVTALLALADGDSAALSGEPTITNKVWTDKAGVARPGLGLVAHAVLTSYHVSRTRQAVRKEASMGPSAEPHC
jgi:hypothetical protein